jgi:hypothetical protein
VRDREQPNGWSLLTYSSEGGPQGNALTSLAFVATIDSVLKSVEEEFGVEVRAIHDDMTLIGDPDVVFGEGKALEKLLTLLAEKGLKPNFKKFQAIGTTPDALQNKPAWIQPIPNKSEIDQRDPTTGETILAWRDSRLK